MRKLIAVLFAVGLLLGASSPAWAGRDHTGNPGPRDNCTANYWANASIALNNGESWHACD